jgi:hypothetical protein
MHVVDLHKSVVENRSRNHPWLGPYPTPPFTAERCHRLPVLVSQLVRQPRVIRGPREKCHGTFEFRIL